MEIPFFLHLMVKYLALDQYQHATNHNCQYREDEDFLAETDEK